MIPMTYHYDGRPIVTRAADEARKKGQPWFVHHSSPGRILPSELGGCPGPPPHDKYCIHGDPLDAACPDCDWDHPALVEEGAAS